MKPFQRRALKVFIASFALVIALVLNSIYDKTSNSLLPTEEVETTSLASNDFYSYRKVSAICQKAASAGTMKTEKVELQFAPPQPVEERTTNCPWGRGDNLKPRLGKIMARYEQLRVVSLPENSVLCSLKMNFRDTAAGRAFRHRDFYFLTMNGRILATDAEFVLQHLQEEKTTIGASQTIRSYLYDWSRVLAARIPADLANDGSREYCIGRDASLSSCSVSKSHQPSLQLTDQVAQWLGAEGFGQSQKFTFIVTGDSDEKGDCYHSGLNLQMELGYAID